MPDIDPNKSSVHRCKHGNDWLACDECDRASRVPPPDPNDTSARQWIIQRCINAFRNEYEDWPGFCERLMNKSEMMTALYKCEQEWPEHEFRGHNVINQRPGRDRLRAVQ